MALFIRGRAPKAIRVGEIPITRVMLGEHLVFDGTVPAVVALPRATATASATAPAVTAGASVALPVATAVSEARTPTVTAGARITPEPAEAAAAGLVPAVSSGASISLIPAMAFADAIPPDIQVVASGEVLLPRAEATAAALVPEISVVAVVAPPPATAVAEALPPTVTAGGSVSPPTAAASASALAPSISAGQSITLPRAQATAAALVPTASVPAAITLPTATATATALAPTTYARTYPKRVATNGQAFGASANGATSYTISYPSGSASGDLLVMQVQMSRTAAGAYLPTVPTGGGTWTQILTQDDSATNGVYFSYWYCVRGSETSVTVSATVTSSHRPMVVSIQAFQAGTFDAVLPVGDAACTYSVSSSAAAITSGATSPTATMSEILSMSAWAISGNSTTLATSWTSPAVEAADFRQYVSAASITWNHSIAYEDRSSAGGSPTYTATPSAAVFQKIVASIVINPIGTTTLVAQDDFNRSAGALGSNWSTLGGGTIAIDSNGYASGASVPSFPMSYAFSTTVAPSANQIVEATVRWNGNDPAHSCAGIALRANPTLYNAAGATGAIFWFVRDLMGIMYENQADSAGFIPATGTSQYNATTKFPEAARIRLVARNNTYKAYVNGVFWIGGTISNSVVPTTANVVGIMIQNDSLVTSPTPGGDPPACLDDFKAYTY